VTEAEWLACDDAQQMVRFMHYRASARKFRLYDVACCRSIGSLWRDEQCQEVVAVAERYADGLARGRDMVGLRYGGYALGWITLKKRVRKLYHSIPGHRAARCALLRELLGNPFRPAPVIIPTWLAWNSGTVGRLAELAYCERELPSGHISAASLALVADALEDAGCTDAEILGHLRSAGPHLRGCWAVDQLTGRA
jgi:hypothetical protein